MTPTASVTSLRRHNSFLHTAATVRAPATRSQSLLEQPPGQTAHPDTLVYDYGDAVRDSTTWAEWKANGWEVFVHPTGVLYYHHAKDNITTSVDLVQCSPADIVFPTGPPSGDFAEYERLVQDDGGLMYVDHRMKAISFLDQDPVDFQQKVQAGGGNYPCHYQGSELTVQDQSWIAARDALQCCYADRLLFGRVNSAFSKQDSKELLDLLSSMHKDRGPVRNWFIASILRAIYTNRVMTSYGQPDARELRRREREEAPHTIEKHTWPIAAVYYFAGSILCLGVPYAYFTRIQRVDRTRFGDGVSAERWRSFISSLLKEWRDSTLVATVLLAANVSFLAIPALDSTSHMLSMLSIMASTGSIMMGFFLVWRHQARESSSATTGLQYFMRARLRTGSSVPLSFALCIPLVLLLWAFLGFLAAICVYAFRGKREVPDPPSAPIPIHTSFSVVGMLSLLVVSAIVAWRFFMNVWAPGVLGEHWPWSTPGGHSDTSSRFRMSSGTLSTAALHDQGLPLWDRGYLHRGSTAFLSPGSSTLRPPSSSVSSPPVSPTKPQPEAVPTVRRPPRYLRSVPGISSPLPVSMRSTMARGSLSEVIVQSRLVSFGRSDASVSTMSSSNHDGRDTPTAAHIATPSHTRRTTPDSTTSPDAAQHIGFLGLSAVSLRSVPREEDVAQAGEYGLGPLTASPRSIMVPSLGGTPNSSPQTLADNLPVNSPRMNFSELPAASTFPYMRFVDHDDEGSLPASSPRRNFRNLPAASTFPHVRFLNHGNADDAEFIHNSSRPRVPPPRQQALSNLNPDRPTVSAPASPVPFHSEMTSNGQGWPEGFTGAPGQPVARPRHVLAATASTSASSSTRPPPASHYRGRRGRAITRHPHVRFSVDEADEMPETPSEGRWFE